MNSINCEICDGKGCFGGDRDCYDCNGTGKINKEIVPTISSKVPCYHCCTTGYICDHCNGTGFVGEGKELSSDMELEILNKGVEILKKYGMLSVASYIEKIVPVIRESGVNKGTI